MQPLLPATRRLGPLLEQAHGLVRGADRLSGLCQPGALGGLRGLLRAMNAYYAQKFEGLKMQPLEIEQALRGERAADPENAVRQRLALAHMATEAQLEMRWPGWDAKTVWSPQMVCDIHQDVYARLPEADRALKGGATLRPGALQSGPAKVRALLEQWGNVYGGVHGGGGMPVLAMAASHQRLLGIQPFREGSGRVARLHTHLVLGHLGLTNGLWSPLRGFARSQDAYRAHLAAATDARGLEAWIGYVLAQCAEQVQLMTGLLAPQDMQDRIAACLGFEEHVVKQGVRTESLRALHYLFVTQGALERRDFKAMLGLGERMATTQIGALLQRGLLETDSPHGKLRFGVPQHALRFYFPKLWPEAERGA
ncbi:Fic family protein [Acidovorax sp.]|uniref:Fic family protein n=1 Tax=Acidovorax sp. TaxID=1872122 RepID=UPI003A0FE26F